MYSIFVLEQGDRLPPDAIADIVLQEREGFLYVTESNNTRLWPGDRVHIKVDLHGS